MTDTPLLAVENLAKSYRLPRQHLLAPAPEIEALSGVSFTLQKGRSLEIGRASCRERV